MEEHVTVVATRTDKRIEDQPMRVEVLDREEIEEKLLMTPGDIVMMLNEMGGCGCRRRRHRSAPRASIQGMRGRYTRFLSDGLPLFGEQVGSFGLLQIPPTRSRRRSRSSKAWRRRCTAPARWAASSTWCRAAGAKRDQES
jgi:iron complex outermembrane receptor protein